MIENNLPFSTKQMQFIKEASSTWNLAHGSVRTGKTICTLFSFLHACYECPDSQIYMVGHTSETLYHNVIRLIFESPQFAIFKPFCTWMSGKRQLSFNNKIIQTLGAKDEGSLGNFQGKTFSLVYCDEMTLYPLSIIDMIETRLSKDWSQGFASMNPSHPEHKLKKWIDEAEKGNKDYYALHFTLDDNPFLPQDYKKRIASSLSGLFYRRYYLGEWCLAEGVIYDAFDPQIHVVDRPPTAADYWIASVDYGTQNPFCCLLIGINTGKHTGTGVQMWVEKEYYYDPKIRGRQKTNEEYAEDVLKFIEPYGVKLLYIDPSAEAFQLELRRKNLHSVHANNKVDSGIQQVASALYSGKLSIVKECKNLIKELQTYSWCPKAARQGYDEPLKVNDHACDALRYALATHKVSIYDANRERQRAYQYQASKFGSSDFGIYY